MALSDRNIHEVTRISLNGLKLMSNLFLDFNELNRNKENHSNCKEWEPLDRSLSTLAKCNYCNYPKNCLILKRSGSWCCYSCWGRMILADEGPWQWYEEV